MYIIIIFVQAHGFDKTVYGTQTFLKFYFSFCPCHYRHTNKMYVLNAVSHNIKTFAKCVK